MWADTLVRRCCCRFCLPRKLAPISKAEFFKRARPEAGPFALYSPSELCHIIHMRSLVVGASRELRYRHTSTMDTLSRTERSERMARIRGRDTKPELAVRRLLHQCGFRYRLHRATLPGKPDLVFPSRHKAIFVHGCFWHRHPGCRLARLPKSRLQFWLPKLEENRARDLKNIRRLRKLGWKTHVVWECQLRDVNRLGPGRGHTV